jgi:hypothetical protein
MLKATALLGAALAAAPLPALATIVETGPYDVGSTSGAGSFALKPGSYEFLFNFTDPVTFQSGFVEKQTVTNLFCVDPDVQPGEFLCGGDEVPTQPLFEPVDSTHYHARLTVDAPRTFTFPPGSTVVRGTTFDVCCTYGFDFESVNPGTFTLSYEAVPEPASWVFMLIGFVGSGAFIRLRRATLATVGL